MSKKRLFDEVASKTGESRKLIRQRGFSPLLLDSTLLDMADSETSPQQMDWDALEQQRGISLMPIGR